MTDTPGSIRRLLDSATRVGGPDGPSHLAQKIADARHSWTLHELATLLTEKVDTAHSPAAVLDAVVGVLLRPSIPLVAPDAILGMTALAIAEHEMRRGHQDILAGLERELAEGRRLTETTAWHSFVEKGGFDLEQVFDSAVASRGLQDVLACAADPERGASRTRALVFLARRATDRRRGPLPAADATEVGRLLREALTSVPPTLDSGYSEAWVLCDRAGAEAELVRRFDATGESDERLLYYLGKAKRTAPETAKWRAHLQRMVDTRLRGGTPIGLNLADVWRRSAPLEAERYLTGLDVTQLPEWSRAFVAGMLRARTSPEAFATLRAIASLGGVPGENARRALQRGDARQRKLREEHDARVWRETGAAESLKRLYVEYIQHVDMDAKFDRWMTLLGADGIREAYTFRARDRDELSLFVDVDKRGRLQGITFDE